MITSHKITTKKNKKNSHQYINNFSIAAKKIKIALRGIKAAATTAKDLKT